METDDRHPYRTKLGIPVGLTQDGEAWTARNVEIMKEAQGSTADAAMASFDAALIAQYESNPFPLPDWVASLVGLNRRRQVKLTWRWPNGPKREYAALIPGRGEDLDKLIGDLKRVGAKPAAQPWIDPPLFESVEALREHLSGLLTQPAVAEGELDLGDIDDDEA